MEDDPDYQSLHNTILLFVVGPILLYGIIRLLFHLQAGPHRGRNPIMNIAGF